MTASSTAKDQGLLWPAKDTALQYQEFTGTFKADGMAFHDFPYDRQTLIIDLVIPELHTSSKDVKLVPRLSQASLDRFADGDVDGAGHAFWIRSVEVEGGLLSNGALSLLQNVDLKGQRFHPLKEFVENQLPTQEGAAEVSQSKARLKIKVAREPNFYATNIVIPICLLMLLGWYNFLLVSARELVYAAAPNSRLTLPQPCDKIEDRLAISVTLYLALIAFQTVINAWLPQVAYMTRLHMWIIFANAQLSAVALESIAVFYMYREALEGSMKAEQAGRRASKISKILSTIGLNHALSGREAKIAVHEVEAEGGEEEEREARDDREFFGAEDEGEDEEGEEEGGEVARNVAPRGTRKTLQTAHSYAKQGSHYFKNQGTESVKMVRENAANLRKKMEVINFVDKVCFVLFPAITVVMYIVILIKPWEGSN